MANRPEETKGKEKKGNPQEQPLAPSAPTSSWRRELAPWSGFGAFDRLREEFNRMFDRFMPNWPMVAGNGQRDHWGLDVQEDDKAVTVHAEAPGFEPGDFDLQMRGNELVLHAARKAETEEKERGFHEWRRQELYRSVALPPGIDAEHIDAEYRNGILTVTLPKTEASKGRHIPVKS
jgi:HSP20 family protein